jgi:hypothetical protein
MTDEEERERHARIKAEVLAVVAALPHDADARMSWRNVLLLLSAIVVPFAVWLALGGIRTGPRPLWYVGGTVLGWGIAAAWALWAALARRGSMLGPSRRWLRAVVFLVPSTIFAWMMLWDLLDPDRLAPWPDRIGLKCLGFTLGAGAWPAIALILMRRGTDPVHPGASGAAIGAAVGCATGVLVDLWCPVADPSHVLLGHILPLALLSLGGVILGRKLLDMRGK